jgi:hypothetical protein
MLSSSFLLALTAGLDHGRAENNERTLASEGSSVIWFDALFESGCYLNKALRIKVMRCSRQTPQNPPPPSRSLYDGVEVNRMRRIY